MNITAAPSLSLNVCLGVLRAIVSTREDNDGNELPIGHILDSDWILLTSAQPWIGSRRPRVTKLLDDLLQGSLELLGLPRITVSAEHIAAIVAFFVHPANFPVAASWMEREVRPAAHEDIAIATPEGEMNRVESSQLLTLIYECYGHESFEAFRVRWEAKTAHAANSLNQAG